MNRAGGPQRRTTYLISLTLVKLESAAAAQGDAETAEEGAADGAPPEKPPPPGPAVPPPGPAAPPPPPRPRPEDGGRGKRPERLFQRQDALRISTAPGCGPPEPPPPRGPQPISAFCWCSAVRQ